MVKASNNFPQTGGNELSLTIVETNHKLDRTYSQQRRELFHNTVYILISLQHRDMGQRPTTFLQHLRLAVKPMRSLVNITVSFVPHITI